VPRPPPCVPSGGTTTAPVGALSGGRHLRGTFNLGGALRPGGLERWPLGVRRGEQGRGLQTIVREGETGFLVAPGDAADLAAKMDLLFSDPGLRARMGAATCPRRGALRLAKCRKEHYGPILEDSRPMTP